MNHALRTLFAISVLIAVSTTSRAATILDTGPVEGEDWEVTPLGSHLWRAHQIEVSEQTRIDAVEGFLARIQGPDELKTALFTNSEDDLPDRRIFEADLSVPLTPLTGNERENADWHGVSGLNWVVATGTYWVAFLADDESTFSGLMPFDRSGNAATAGWTGEEDPPFPGEPPIPAAWRRFTANMGFRVLGEPVPEPSFVLFASGGFLFAILRSRTRQP